MKIREVNENKKQFIALLLLADEQENMIDHYLEKGTMYVLEDGNVKAECVVTDEDNGILEIKNIAVDPQNQGQGYGKALIDYPTATEKELAYYVSGNVLEPIGRDYLYSELINPIFTKDGDNVKVKVAVKFLDNQTKATQVSQYELVLHKDSNWKIVG